MPHLYRATTFVFRATFEQPQIWSGCSLDAQTQKILCWCNCFSMTLVPSFSLNHPNCCSDTTCHSKDAEWRQSHCHGCPYLPWSLNGGTMVATMITQWSFSGCYWLARSATAVVQGRPKCHSNWNTMFKQNAFLWGSQWPITVHPFCDHGDICAFLLPPLSDLRVTDLLGILWLFWTCWKFHGNHGWRPWKGLNILCTTLEQPRKLPASLCIKRQPCQSCSCTREEKRSQSLCKGGISAYYHTKFAS